jgi:hypothetical protein
VNIDVELVRFYGSVDGGFRGIQKAALRAIIHGDEAVYGQVSTWLDAGDDQASIRIS